MSAAVVAAVVATVSALGACGLPTTSPVQQGLEVGSPLVPPVRFQFEAPPRGAEPEEIVRGFLAASWSMDDDFRAARAYLTPQASRAWNPRSAVTVYPDSASLQVVGDRTGTFTLRTRQDAALDAGGRYRTMPTGSMREFVLKVTQASGEWRISSVPADFGLWLSRFYFERAYRPLSLAYADHRLRMLVVDRRWFPVGAGLSTTLARAQLEAPPTYLSGAVRSGFPPDTRLSVDSVPVDLGRAEIDLSPGVLDVSVDERRAAWAQMLTTMRQVSGVESVALQVSGRILDVAGEGSTGTLPYSLEELGFGASALAVPKVVWRTDGGIAPVETADVGRRDVAHRGQNPSLPQVGPQWSALAASADLLDVAALSADRTRLRRWRAGGAGERAIGGELTPPVYDRDGTLWVAGTGAAGSPDRVWTIDAPAGLQAQPRALFAPWLDVAAGEKLLAVRPAPDGQRVLVVRQGPAGVGIGVSGVLRDTTGSPIGLTDPWAIGGDITEVTSSAWLSNTTIAVLGRRPDGAGIVPMLVSVGGVTTPLAPVPDPRRVLGAGGERGVIVISGDGHAYGRVGGGWQQLGAATDVVVPGY